MLSLCMAAPAMPIPASDSDPTATKDNANFTNTEFLDIMREPLLIEDLGTPNWFLAPPSARHRQK